MISIKKFLDYSINENNENLIPVIDDKLDELKSKLEKLFSPKDEFGASGIEKGDEVIKKFGEEEQKQSDSFKMLNLDSLEKSQFSKTSRSLKLIYSDDEFRYDVTFTIQTKDVATPEGQELNQEGLENCYVTFKRYDSEDNLHGQIIDEKVQIKNIDETFFDEMKMKLDEKTSDEESDEEFEIEFEDQGGESEESPKTQV